MKAIMIIVFSSFLVLIAKGQNQVKLKDPKFDEVGKSSLKELQDLNAEMVRKSKKPFTRIQLKVDEYNKVFKFDGSSDVFQITLLHNNLLKNDWDKSSLSFIETFTPIEIGKQERYVERVNTQKYKAIIFFTNDQILGLSSFILYKSLVDSNIYFITYISDSIDKVKINNMKRVIVCLQTK
ncbi:hypothetical protein [Sphingobacterium kyonggiense]